MIIKPKGHPGICQAASQKFHAWVILVLAVNANTDDKTQRCVFFTSELASEMWHQTGQTGNYRANLDLALKYALQVNHPLSIYQSYFYLL